MADDGIIPHTKHIAMHNSILQCERARSPIRSISCPRDALQAAAFSRPIWALPDGLLVQKGKPPDADRVQVGR
jgi:hypothetical protein